MELLTELLPSGSDKSRKEVGKVVVMLVTMGGIDGKTGFQWPV